MTGPNGDEADEFANFSSISCVEMCCSCLHPLVLTANRSITDKSDWNIVRIVTRKSWYICEYHAHPGRISEIWWPVCKIVLTLRIPRAFVCWKNVMLIKRKHKTRRICPPGTCSGSTSYVDFGHVTNADILLFFLGCSLCSLHSPS